MREGNKDVVSFGAMLRQARQRRGWSALNLAKRVGLAHSTLSRIEHGSRRPSRTAATKLAEAVATTDVERDDLLALAGFNRMDAETAFAKDAATIAFVRAVANAMPSLSAESRVVVERLMAAIMAMVEHDPLDGTDEARTLTRRVQRMEGVVEAASRAAAALGDALRAGSVSVVALGSVKYDLDRALNALGDEHDRR